MLDDWLVPLFDEQLAPLEAICAESGPAAFGEFRHLGDDLWALLLSRQYTCYPSIRALMPDLPDPLLQQRWNGASGLELLSQSRAFYGLAKDRFARHCERSLEEAAVLDFGCGWGRLMRFFARDVELDALFGVDPAEEILEVCRRSRMPGELARCQFAPTSLPLDRRIDLAYAFSVFTHISEPTHEACLRAIHAALNPGGLLILTIRPPSYLRLDPKLHGVLAGLGPEPLEALKEPRYLFVAHEADPEHPQYEGGEMTYGETVISLPYVRERWAELFELLDVSTIGNDLYQVALTLRRHARS